MLRFWAASTTVLIVPQYMALKDSGRINIIVSSGAGTLAGMSFYVITPSGQMDELISRFRLVASGLPFMTVFDMSYAYLERGNYIFALHDIGTTETILARTDVAEWTSNIDMPLSKVAGQRADIQRTFSRVNRG